MGIFFLAERADGELEQTVALELVKRGLDTEAVLDRFRRERQILARLEHAAIARLLEGGVSTDGPPFFAVRRRDPLEASRHLATKALARLR
jgi:eukaryotic-like serine/threonine-protein kinase